MPVIIAPGGFVLPQQKIPEMPEIDLSSLENAIKVNTATITKEISDREERQAEIKRNIDRIFEIIDEDLPGLIKKNADEIQENADEIEGLREYGENITEYANKLNNAIMDIENNLTNDMYVNIVLNNINDLVDYMTQLDEETKQEQIRVISEKVTKLSVFIKDNKLINKEIIKAKIEEIAKKVSGTKINSLFGMLIMTIDNPEAVLEQNLQTNKYINTTNVIPSSNQIGGYMNMLNISIAHKQ